MFTGANTADNRISQALTNHGDLKNSATIMVLEEMQQQILMQMVMETLRIMQLQAIQQPLLAQAQMGKNQILIQMQT